MHKYFNLLMTVYDAASLIVKNSYTSFGYGGHNKLILCSCPIVSKPVKKADRSLNYDKGVRGRGALVRSMILDRDISSSGVVTVQGVRRHGDCAKQGSARNESPN